MRALRLTLISSCFILVTLLIGKGMLSYASASLMPEKATDTPKTNYEPVLHIGRGDIQTIAWQPNGTDLLISTARGTWIYTPDLQEKTMFEAAYATYNSDGGFIAGVINAQQVRLWNAINYAALDALYTHDHPVMALAWSPAGDKIASLDTDGRIIIHSFGKNAQDVRLWLPDAKNIQWSKGGTYLAGQDKSGKVLVWKALSGEVINEADNITPPQKIYKYNEQNYPIDTVTWRNDSELFLRTEDSYWGHIFAYLWDVTTRYEDLKENAEVEFYQPLGNKNIFNHLGNRFFSIGTHAVVYDVITQSPFAAKPDEGPSLFIDDYVYAVNHWLDWVALSAAWQANDRLLAVGFDCNRLYFCDTDGIEIFDTIERRHVWGVQTEAPVTHLAWHPDQIRLASISQSGRIEIWDTTSENAPRVALSDDFIQPRTVAFSPDNRFIAVADAASELKILDTQTGAISQRFLGIIYPIVELQWQPQGRFIALRTVSPNDIPPYNGDIVSVWDLSPQRTVFFPFNTNATSMTWSPDGNELATLSPLGQLKIWDASTQTVRLDIQLCHYVEDCSKQNYVFKEIGWSPDGQLLYTNSQDYGKHIPEPMSLLWRAEDGTFVEWVGMGDTGLNSTTFNQQNDWLLAEQWGDKTAKNGKTYAPYVWRFFTTNSVTGQNGQTSIQLPPPFSSPVSRINFSPDGSALVGQDSEHHAMVWSMPEGELRFDLLHAEKIIWSSDSTQLAILNADEPIQILDAQTGKLLDTLQPYHNAADWWQSATQIFWNADSQQIAIIDAGVVTLWR